MSTAVSPHHLAVPLSEDNMTNNNKRRKPSSPTPVDIVTPVTGPQRPVEDAVSEAEIVAAGQASLLPIVWIEDRDSRLDTAAIELLVKVLRNPKSVLSRQSSAYPRYKEVIRTASELIQHLYSTRSPK